MAVGIIRMAPSLLDLRRYQMELEREKKNKNQGDAFWNHDETPVFNGAASGWP
jgi:hypothetical protein